MEWPGIQIPQSLLILLKERPILCPFSDDKGKTHNSNICFYDRNPAGKGLDFDANPDQREPFMRYAVSFQIQNRTDDLSRLSLPSLFDISRDIDFEMQQFYDHHTPARKTLEKLLRAADTYPE